MTCEVRSCRSAGGDLLLDAVAGAVQFALVHPRQIQDRLAQCLRRDGAGVDADTAQHLTVLHDRHLLAEFGGRHRGFLTARSRTDDDQVIFHFRRHTK